MTSASIAGERTDSAPRADRRDRGGSGVVCPSCGDRSDGPEAISEGGFLFTCRGCASEWSVRVAMFSKVPDVDPKAFRHDLRRGFARSGLTQTMLADLLDVTPAYVSMVLQGRRVPARPRRWLEAVGIHDLPT